jgi:hypothetical protein
MALTSLGLAVVAGLSTPARRESDWTFLKSVASELGLAWQDADEAGPTRAALERVMGKVGMDLDDGEWTLATHGGGLIVIR